jgi:lipopolysaccharide/colanic/teichoic acid biosynthesis glycosyltransferase
MSGRVRRYLVVRRAVELTMIALVAPLLLLVSGLVAAAIWLEDGGPVFFKQPRLGRATRPFLLFKFRTMRVTRDLGVRLAEPGDPRVTTVGRVLRRLHLDELPQLWNVVRGDMSLIGPRPVPQALHATYLARIEGYDRRHLIRPGLMGQAQVMLGYTNDLAGEQRKWLLDLEYIRDVSWRLDARILAASMHLPGSGLSEARRRLSDRAA